MAPDDGASHVHLLDESFRQAREVFLVFADWKLAVRDLRAAELKSAMALDRQADWAGARAEGFARLWHAKAMQRKAAAEEAARWAERRARELERSNTRLLLEAKQSREEKMRKRRLKRAAAAAAHALARHESRLRGVRALRCWFAMWDSPVFWRVLPWTISLPLLGWLAFDTLLTCLVLTDLSPDPVATNARFFQGVLFALLIGWCVQDPIVILVRNNLACTKGIVRSKRYQTLEKFVVGPIMTGIKALSDC